MLYSTKKESFGRNQNLPIQMVIILGFSVVAYMLFLITTSVYKDYKNEQHLKKIESESQKILEDNIKKSSDYLYFLSDQFKDKYAKETLSKINPGEQVIVFTETEQNLFAEKKQDEEQIELILYMSKPKQWIQYFFGEGA